MLPPQDLQAQGWPDSTFFAYTHCFEGACYWGYPHHSSLVHGVNDTVEVLLILDNHSTDHIDIRYESPGTWAVPYIYNSMGDMQHNRYMADTSDFDYYFSHWVQTAWFGVIPKPDTLFSKLDTTAWGQIKYNPCALVFKLWNVPIGIKAIEFKKTSLAPKKLTFIRYDLTQYWYVEPIDQRDTINAYLELSMRSIKLGNSTAAYAWVDSIFALNDSSYAGWNQKAYLDYGYADSLTNIQNYSRIISIFENNSDPIIDLSDSLLSDEERSWASDYYRRAIYYKWAWETGHQHDPPTD